MDRLGISESQDLSDLRAYRDVWFSSFARVLPLTIDIGPQKGWPQVWFTSSLWTSKTSEGPGYSERGRAGGEAQAALVP